MRAIREVVAGLPADSARHLALRDYHRLTIVARRVRGLGYAAGAEMTAM